MPSCLHPSFCPRPASASRFFPPPHHSLFIIHCYTNIIHYTRAAGHLSHVSLSLSLRVGLGGNDAPSFTPDEAFIIKHFAGDVTYAVEGFLDKNMDPLNEDVEKMMNQSKLDLIHQLFPYV